MAVPTGAAIYMKSNLWGGHKKHSVLDWSTELLYTTYNKTWHIIIKTVSQMGYTVMLDICEETEHVHKHINTIP
jgi:hypothetical protein